MPGFNDVSDFKDQLIRKALTGAFFLSPISAPALTTISDTGGQLLLPTALKSIGKLATDGSEKNLEQEVQAVRGWGDSAPARQDVESETITLSITAIETRKNVLGLMNGSDLSSVVANAKHEVTYDRPAVPVLIDYRGLLLTKDINKANGLEVYYGIHLPKINITVNGGVNLQPGENPMQYPFTVTALLDSTVGTAERTFWAGPGMAGLKTDMGFVAP